MRCTPEYVENILRKHVVAVKGKQVLPAPGNWVYRRYQFSAGQGIWTCGQGSDWNGLFQGLEAALSVP